MDFKEFIKNISSPGDVAAASLGFAAGFAVDLFLLPVGVPPGTLGGLGATTAFGLKKSVDAWRNEQKNKKEITKQEELIKSEQTASHKNLLRRAEAFKNILSEAKTENLASRFNKEFKLWESKVITDKEFENILNDLVGKYREEL